MRVQNPATTGISQNAKKQREKTEATVKTFDLLLYARDKLFEPKSLEYIIL